MQNGCVHIDGAVIVVYIENAGETYVYCVEPHNIPYEITEVLQLHSYTNEVMSAGCASKFAAYMRDELEPYQMIPEKGVAYKIMEQNGIYIKTQQVYYIILP